MLTTSFMEEAFGGLVRDEGFRADDLLKRITFEYTDPFDADYVDEIRSDIQHAEPNGLNA